MLCNTGEFSFWELRVPQAVLRGPIYVSANWLLDQFKVQKCKARTTPLMLRNPRTTSCNRHCPQCCTCSGDYQRLPSMNPGQRRITLKSSIPILHFLSSQILSSSDFVQRNIWYFWKKFLDLNWNYFLTLLFLPPSFFG